jgi:type I restriction enzyme M protein
MTTTEKKRRGAKQNGTARTISGAAAMNAYVKGIANIMRRSGRAGALQYVPEMTWMIFLRILDEREQREAEESRALGLRFRPTLEPPYRWFDWAAPYDASITDAEGRSQGWYRKKLREGEFDSVKEFVNSDLIPTVRRFEQSAAHGSRQHVLSQIFADTPRTYIDTEHNLLEILDRVHQLSEERIDTTHIFPLSQVYEGMLLSMGQKNNDGGQFFTPREVIRAMVRVVAPRPGQTVYDPGCGTGGFLVEAFTYMLVQAGDSADQIAQLKTATFYGREKDAQVYPIALANMVLHGIDVPRIWHGNTLTGDATYARLFEDAPSQFDVVLTNPPFGGKESKAAQARFTHKTNATQVLFLQHIFDSLADGGVCGIVLDEGVLFRTNEGGFLGTKKKLCDDHEVFCIVSLPGGVFTDAGAGVKTDLVFFRKGQPTNRIWYYDLSDLKINKGNPLKLSHFDDFLQRIALPPDDPGRESPRSWTVDFAARRRQAQQEAEPHQTHARSLIAEASGIDRKIARLRAQIRQAATLEERNQLRERIGEQEAERKAKLKQAREAEAEAQAILSAVYDLKAVNPNAADTRDRRTPAELLAIIEEAQAEIAKGIAALRNGQTQQQESA